MHRAILGFLVAFSLTASGFAGSDSVFTRVADGFDFPVGDAEGHGYYKARGYHANGHLGEDWNGGGGGDTDLGDPVYATGHGVVVLARNVKLGWGNVVIVRHAYYEAGSLRFIDSLYGHLERILVREGQQVSRRQRIGTIGSNFGMYEAHLHFEIRKNLAIGMNRASFARDSSNYYDPTAFIRAHRSATGGPDRTLVAMNTFAAPASYSASRSTAPSHANVKMSITATYRDFKVRRFE